MTLTFPRRIFQIPFNGRAFKIKLRFRIEFFALNSIFFYLNADSQSLGLMIFKPVSMKFANTFIRFSTVLTRSRSIIRFMILTYFRFFNFFGDKHFSGLSTIFEGLSFLPIKPEGGLRLNKRLFFEVLRSFWFELWKNNFFSGKIPILTKNESCDQKSDSRGRSFSS